jgi:hypothetical protein
MYAVLLSYQGTRHHRRTLYRVIGSWARSIGSGCSKLPPPSCRRTTGSVEHSSACWHPPLSQLLEALATRTSEGLGGTAQRCTVTCSSASGPVTEGAVRWSSPSSPLPWICGTTSCPQCAGTVRLRPQTTPPASQREARLQATFKYLI